MGDLIQEPCPKCHRVSVDVEFRYRRPWMLGIVYLLILVVLAALAKGVLPFIPASHETRLVIGCLGAGILANVLRRLLEPRLAKREARLRCRLCGDMRVGPAMANQLPGSSPSGT